MALLCANAFEKLDVEPVGNLHIALVSLFEVNSEPKRDLNRSRGAKRPICSTNELEFVTFETGHDLYD